MSLWTLAYIDRDGNETDCGALPTDSGASIVLQIEQNLNVFTSPEVSLDLPDYNGDWALRFDSLDLEDRYPTIRQAKIYKDGDLAFHGDIDYQSIKFTPTKDRVSFTVFGKVKRLERFNAELVARPIPNENYSGAVTSSAPGWIEDSAADFPPNLGGTTLLAWMTHGSVSVCGPLLVISNTATRIYYVAHPYQAIGGGFDINSWYAYVGGAYGVRGLCARFVKGSNKLIFMRAVSETLLQPGDALNWVRTTPASLYPLTNASGLEKLELTVFATGPDTSRGLAANELLVTTAIEWDTLYPGIEWQYKMTELLGCTSGFYRNITIGEAVRRLFWHAGCATADLMAPGDSNTLALLAHCAGGTCYIYKMLASPYYVLATGDVLHYDVWISDSSPEARSALDIWATSWTLRDSGAVDQNGRSAHPATDLSSVAKGQWYHREIAIPASGVGKRLDGLGNAIYLAMEGDTAGDYKSLIRNAKIVNTGVTTLSLYEGDRDFQWPADSNYTLNAGYSVTLAGVALANATEAVIDYTPYLSGLLAPGSDPALYLRAVNTGAGNCYYYRQIAHPSYTLATGDVLEYDVYLEDSAPAFNGGIDLIASDWTLRGANAVDQNGVSAGTWADLSGRAKGQWYHRAISIPASGLGKVLSSSTGGVFWAFESDAQGTYGVYLKAVKITNGGVTKATIWDGDTDFGWPSYNFATGYAGSKAAVAIPLSDMPEEALEYADFTGQNVAQALADLALEANAVLAEQPDQLQFIGRDCFSDAVKDIDSLLVGSPSDSKIWRDYYNVVSVKGLNDRQARYGQLTYPARKREVEVKHCSRHDWLQRIAERLYGWFARKPRVLDCEIWDDDYNYQLGGRVSARGAEWDIVHVEVQAGSDTIGLQCIQRDVDAPLPGSTRLDGEVVFTDPPYEPLDFVLTTNYSQQFRLLFPVAMFPPTRTDYYWNGSQYVYVTSTLYELRWRWPYDDLQDMLFGFLALLYETDRDSPIINVPANVPRQSDGYYYMYAYVWQSSNFMGDVQAIFKNGLISVPSVANSSSNSDDGDYYGIRTPEGPANSPYPLVECIGCFADPLNLPSATNFPEGTLGLVKVSGLPGRIYIVGHDDTGAKVWQRFDAVT